MQIYTGEGKGKTTASLGLLLRSWGHDHTSPRAAVHEGAIPSIGRDRGAAAVSASRWCRRASTTGSHKDGVTDEDRAAAAAGLARAREIVMSGDFDVVVLDEVWTAVQFELLPLDRRAGAACATSPRTPSW